MAAKGRNVLVKVLLGGVYTTIAGIRTRTIVVDNDTVDTTSSDEAPWRDLLSDAGARQLSISGAAVFKNAAAQKYIEELSMSGVGGEFRVMFENGDVVSGYFFVATIEKPGEHVAEEGWTLALVSSQMSIFARSGPIPGVAYTQEWIALNFDRIDRSTNGLAWTLQAGPGGPTFNGRIPYRDPVTGTWLAGTAGNFVARSTDGGITWAMIAVPAIPGAAYVSSVISNGFGSWLIVSVAGYVARSLDDGLTWTDISANFTSTDALYDLFGLARTDTGRVVVGSDYGIYYTDNFGNSWSQNSFFLPYPGGLTIPDVLSANGVTYAVAGWATIWRSDDDGATYALDYVAAGDFWGGGLGTLGFEFQSLDYCVSTDTWIVVGAVTEAVDAFVIVRKVGLGAWTNIGSSVPGTVPLYPLAGINLPVAVACDRGGVWVIRFFNGETIRSTNNGNTFTDITGSLTPLTSFPWYGLACADIIV